MREHQKEPSPREGREEGEVRGGEEDDWKDVDETFSLGQQEVFHLHRA